MSELKEPETKEALPSRWLLLRDVVAFQFKLAIDGLRDIILSPISITAALIGVLTSKSNPGKYFYRLLELGHDSDRWINLFNTYNDENENRVSADQIFKHAESAVVSEYEKGGVLTTVKNKTDQVIDEIQDRTTYPKS
ncbi:MAG: hypothetical protein JJ921_05700 [Pseudomonadales bacterium]|nr:hypothetical protein [Pseudomonadales bacterium]MBO7005497.1 hypothetical protein [Pseudomonadales bacterium]